MWKNPKMVGFTALTAVLYAALIFPFQQFTIFGGHADFGRVGVGFPLAFSFLFGPAAAWGAAIANIARDVATSRLDAASFFGFIGNFLIGYLPYRLWNAVTKQKPDLRSPKKITLFVGIALLACTMCGLIIGWGLYWLGFTRFMPTALIIAITNSLWAIVLGSIVLALTYGIVSKRKMLYTDLLNIQQQTASWKRSKTLALLTFVVSTMLCFGLGAFLVVDPFVLLAFVGVSVVAIAIVCS